MILHIQRDKSIAAFKVSGTMTLLAALYEIKEREEPSLTFSAGCRASVCGTCAVRVNGKEVLSCAHTIADGDLVEPLRYHPVLRDLKVDRDPARKPLEKEEAWLHQYNAAIPAPGDERLTEKQTDCILCDSCYSACPVLAVNPDFLGPFALTRAFRYTSDRREGEAQDIIGKIQENGVWDCTLCGECTAVCPKGIDPKMDITMLRGTSLQHGYSDPNFAADPFGTPDFSGGFGFDPNTSY